MIDAVRPTILRYLHEGGRYHEPFLGGGAIALSLPSKTPVIANDASRELVVMWRVIRDQTPLLSFRLEQLRLGHSERQYYRVRDEEPEDDVERSARFIYLNKMGFNGLYRVNKSGKFNVPIGRGKVSAIPTQEELTKLSVRLRRSWLLIECGDFEPIINHAIEGDVIFADPPYDQTHDYSSGFGDDDRRRLSAALRRAARRGVGVVFTDSDTRLVRETYKWARLEEYGERRRIAANGDRRAAACIVGARP